MKKLFAILVAMMLCVSAVAEVAAPEEITVELDETYVQVDLGEEYAFAFLPSDWLAIEAEYADETSELLGAFTSADGNAMLLVTYGQSDTGTTYEEVCAKSIEAGLVANLVIINGYEFVNIATSAEDKIVMMSSFFVDEACTAAVTFTFTFAIADAEAMEHVVNQVLGSFDFYE